MVITGNLIRFPVGADAHGFPFICAGYRSPLYRLIIFSNQILDCQINIGEGNTHTFHEFLNTFPVRCHTEKRTVINKIRGVNLIYYC